ncbi:hypothetical protein Syun_023394 [Stephania yunnanensis]|uniref:Uncharacterized protein n=1 Tax=Stephania yunnanensis TaxID=152371 RepID=A0AAP0HZJ8_9MAGN
MNGLSHFFLNTCQASRTFTSLRILGEPPCLHRPYFPALPPPPSRRPASFVLLAVVRRSRSLADHYSISHRHFAYAKTKAFCLCQNKWITLDPSLYDPTELHKV